MFKLKLNQEMWVQFKIAVIRSLSGYMAFWEKYMDMCDKIEKMEEDFTDDEALYYLEVSTKVLQKMY